MDALALEDDWSEPQSPRALYVRWERQSWSVDAIDLTRDRA